MKWIYKGAILFLSVALCFSVANWVRARQELQAVTAANESLRKTLGKLIIAIGEKDREIDRLTGSPCHAGELGLAPGGRVELLTASRKPDGL